MCIGSALNAHLHFHCVIDGLFNAKEERARFYPAFLTDPADRLVATAADQQRVTEQGNDAAQHGVQDTPRGPVKGAPSAQSARRPGQGVVIRTSSDRSPVSSSMVSTLPTPGM